MTQFEQGESLNEFAMFFDAVFQKMSMSYVTKKISHMDFIWVVEYGIYNELNRLLWQKFVCFKLKNTKI